MAPAPSALSIFEDGLGDVNGYNGVSLLSALRRNSTQDVAAQIITSIVDAAQTVVDVLVDEDGRGYRITFGTERGVDAPAFTVMADRKITIGTKVFEEPSLSLPMVATVLTGLVAHEVGHTRVTPTLRKMREAKWPGQALPVVVSTIFEDQRLELRQSRDFPGIAASFDATMWWAANYAGGFASTVYSFDPANDPLGDRVNFAMAASRYRKYIGGLTTDQATVDEAAWWLSLYETVTADTTDQQMIEITVDALHRLLDNLPEPPKPDGPGPEGPVGPGPEGPEGPGPSGPVCGPIGPGGPEGPEGPEGPDGGETPGPEGPGGDEPGPDGGTDGPDGPDGGTDGPTGEGKGKGKGDPKPGEGGTDGPTDTEEGRHTADDLRSVDKHETTPSNGSSTGTAQGTTEGRDDGEFDKSTDVHFTVGEQAKVVNPVDDATTSDKYDGTTVQDAINVERTTLRVKDGDFGSLKVRLVF